jgi:UDP-N-acetylmuramyl pentapeptide synthase
MSFQQIIIRAIANAIYLLRRRAIRQAPIRWVVCTGTSGKTLTRQFIAHALRKTGHAVVSPQLGYTNELGIILAALGIERVSLTTWQGIRTVFTSSLSQQTFVCIELGADFYKDISWFLKRFTPFAVCITSVAPTTWARDRAVIATEREHLIQAITPDGFAIFGGSVSGTLLSYPFILRRQLFEPHIRALNCTVRCMEQLNLRHHFTPTFYEDFIFSSDRLDVAKMRSETTIIADTYKAIPYCTNWFLDMAVRHTAKKKFLIISELRPLWKNADQFYADIAAQFKHFDRIYFIGPQKIYAFLAAHDSRVQHIDVSSFQTVAAEIASNAGSDDAVFIKGSFVYKLDELKQLLFQ